MKTYEALEQELKETQGILEAIQKGEVDTVYNPGNDTLRIETLEQVEERNRELQQVNEQLQKEIVERKKMEEALIQSEKMKSLGIITAGISHEFNNILSVISGNVQLMQMGHKDNRDLLERFRTIMKSVKDGASITSRMLEFTRAGTVHSELSDVVELLKMSIEFIMPKWKYEAQAKGINYQMATEGVCGAYPILCNPTDIREVFINIINNALNAMPDGGTVSFCVWSQNNNVFISISDTGTGMAEKNHKNIFDPFFTTRRPMGTGLGLSVVYSIIKRHFGTITVESEVGKGSTFTLQLPASTKAVSPAVTQEFTQEIIGMGLRILVVDDEVDTCNILDKFLSEKGYVVKTVNDGADAINLIKSETFNLVLCDHVMPHITGCQVVRFIAGLEKRPRIGIITGWGEIDKRLDEEGVKVDFIIKKPFDFSDLTNHISDVIGDGSHVSSG